jgi:hypothetical protein
MSPTMSGATSTIRPSMIAPTNVPPSRWQVASRISAGV